MSILNDITLGRYVHGVSLLHQLDPRIKILSTLVFIGAVVGSKSGFALFVSFLLLCLLGTKSAIPLRLLLSNLRPLILIFILTLGFNSFLTPGTVVYTLPSNLGDFTWEGIVRGLFFSARFSTIVLISSLLTLTTSPLTLADGLESLLRPFRCLGLPLQEFAMTSTIALRFVPILIDETNRLYRAQTARGADFGGGPIRRIKSLYPLIFPLFISAFGRADRLAIAMETRCYRGSVGRTKFIKFSIKGVDWAVLSASLFTSGIILTSGYF